MYLIRRNFLRFLFKRVDLISFGKSDFHIHTGGTEAVKERDRKRDQMFL